MAGEQPFKFEAKQCSPDGHDVEFHHHSHSFISLSEHHHGQPWITAIRRLADCWGHCRCFTRRPMLTTSGKASANEVRQRSDSTFGLTGGSTPRPLQSFTGSSASQTSRRWGRDAAVFALA